MNVPITLFCWSEDDEQRKGQKAWQRQPTEERKEIDFQHKGSL